MRLSITVRLRPHKFLLAALVALSLMNACSAPPFKGYQGPNLPDDQVAILDWSGLALVFEIDGKKPDLRGLIYTGHFPQDQAKLLPGLHTIVYGYWFRHVGSLVRSPTLNMKAGHVYKVKGDACHFCATRAKRGYIWIEDKATGEVVDGVKPGAWRKDRELSVQ